MDEFSKHEVLDRSCLIMNLFGSNILDHEVVEKDEELLKEATEVFNALCNFYQLCGRKFL